MKRLLSLFLLLPLLTAPGAADPALLAAVDRGDPSEVRALIGDYTRQQLGVALARSAAWPRSEVLTVLLASEAELNSLGPHGETAVQVASRLGYPVNLRLLLEAGAKPGIADRDGNRPLHLAARGGWDDCVALLLEASARTDTLNNRGESPLELAVKANRRTVFSALVSNTRRRDFDLILMARARSQELVETLLDEGAKVLPEAIPAVCSSQTEGGDPVLPILRRLANAGGDAGPGLLPAASLGRLELVDWLLQDGIGNDLLQPALDEAVAQGHVPVVRRLLDEGVRVGDASEALDRLDGAIGFLELRIERGKASRMRYRTQVEDERRMARLVSARQQFEVLLR